MLSKNSVRNSTFILILLAMSTIVIALSTPAFANEVIVKRGWTPIPDGETGTKKDITMKNDQLAVTITGAGGSKPPWGVPYGGILDAAPVVKGKIQLDQLTLVDFLPDRWSAWPAKEQKVEIVESGQRGVVKVTRDWYEAELITTYILEPGNDYITMKTKLNNNSNETYEGIRSGYTLCIEGGWIDVPGGRGKHKDILGDWIVGYNEDWAFGLHSDYHNEIKGETTWTEQFVTHTLEPGESRTYESKLQVTASGDASKIIERYLEFTDQPSGLVSGKVRNSRGEVVESPVVIAYKNGEVIGWTVGEEGKYSFTLPAGEYKLEAVAENTSPSSKQRVSINEGDNLTVDFSDIQVAGKLKLNIVDAKTGQDLDARIQIKGGPDYPVRYLGQNTKFTELDDQGKAQFPIAPATYDLNILSGAGFVTEKTTLKEVQVKSGKNKSLAVEVETKAHPNKHNWYSADLHQHSNILDGITNPKDLVTANLAAQLDLVFLSDHDSVERHKKVQDYANKRGVPFIPSIEISPMWAHFIVFPLPIGYDKLPDSGTATEIFEAARKLDDVVVQVAHPQISYGYYYSQKRDRIPGGYDDNYDVVELTENRDEILDRMFEYWNKGKEKYLVTSTDVHDVHSTITGYRRTYAQIEGELTVEKYSQAIKEGNSFVTYGPLVYPKQDFGATYQAENGTFNFSFIAEAVNGLKEVHIIQEGEVVASRILTSDYVELGKTEQKEFAFELEVTKDTWYSIVVIDNEGKKLYSNPVWVKASN